MDSPILSGFTEVDKEFCTKLVDLLIEKTNFEKLIPFYELKPINIEH